MNSVFIPPSAIKGRGAASRIAHRFERDARDAFDDGWGTVDAQFSGDAPALQTQVTFEDARSIISRNDSPDIYFEHSINPYRGCEHEIRSWNALDTCIEFEGLAALCRLMA